jgi:hypothetical protein
MLVQSHQDVQQPYCIANLYKLMYVIYLYASTCSTSSLACVMSAAPVYVTIPAISILRHRAPLRIT